MKVKQNIGVTIVLFSLFFLCGLGISSLSVAKEKISFFCPLSGLEADAMNTVARDFEKMYPGTEVQVTAVPWSQFNEKLMTAIAGGNIPDALYLEAMKVVTYVRGGLIEPLESYIANDKGLNIEDFFPTTLEIGRYKNTQYAIPLTAAISGLYYNVDLLKEAGVTPPKTWDEYVTAAKKLNEPKKKIYGTYVGVQRPLLGYQDRAKTLFAEFFVPNGVELLNKDHTKVVVNSPQAIEATQFIVDLFYKHKVAPLPGAGLDQEIWGNGLIALRPEWLWLIQWTRRNAPKLNFRVTLLPAGRAGHRTLLDCHLLAITSAGKRKETAYKYISFLDSQGVKWPARNERLPARKSFANLPFYLEDPAWSGFVKQLGYATWTQPKVPMLEEILSALGEELDYAFYQKKTPEQALNDAARRGTQLLQEAE